MACDECNWNEICRVWRLNHLRLSIILDILTVGLSSSLWCVTYWCKFKSWMRCRLLHCSIIRMYHKFYIFIFSVVQGNGTWDSAVRAEMITATTLTLTVLITFSVSPWPTCGTASLDMVQCSRSINIYRTGRWASSWLLRSYCPSPDSSASAENWPWVCWLWRFWQWACLEDSCWLSQHSTVFSWRTTALWSSRSRQKIWHKRWLARPWTSLRGRKCEMLSPNCHWPFFFKLYFLFLFVQEFCRAFPSFLLFSPSAHSHIRISGVQRDEPTWPLRRCCARSGLECGWVNTNAICLWLSSSQTVKSIDPGQSPWKFLITVL